MMNKNIVGALVLVLILGGFLFYSLNKVSVPKSDNGKVATPGATTAVAKVNLTAGPVVGSVKSDKGDYLTDTRGMTLYVFADDKKLQSSCEGDCLKSWTPFAYDNKDIPSFTDMLSKRMNTMKRSDASYQYAYGEKPVYFFIGDKIPGDITGNGANGGKWSIVVITK